MCVFKQVLQHYSKPGVTAVEVLPVFPDFEVSHQRLSLYMLRLHDA